MVTIPPQKWQRRTPGRLSSPGPSSVSSSSSENRSRRSVFSQATTASSNSLNNYQHKTSQNSASNKQQQNSTRPQRRESAASSSRPRVQTNYPPSKSNNAAEDVKPDPSNDTAALVDSATGPVDEKLDLFGNFRVEFRCFMDTAEQQNKDFQEQISELEHKLKSNRKTTSEKLRQQTVKSDRLEQELDLCEKEKQSALDQHSQSQKLLNQLKARLDKALKKNDDLQSEVKLHKDEIRELSEQLGKATETNTELHNKFTEMKRACESSEAEKRDLLEQLNTANREKSELDIEMTRAHKSSEVEKQDLQDKLNRKANTMRNERDEAEKMRQSAAEERYAAETKNGHLHTQLSLFDEKITKLENDIAIKQMKHNEKEQKWEVALTEYLSIIQSRDDGMSESEDDQAQEHTDNIETEISTLKSDTETLSKEKKDLTARNIFLQRKVVRVSVRLRTTRRFLTNERANSMRSRKQKKALCTALNQAKEEQARLTIVNRDLEAQIPTLQKDIEDLEDRVTALKSKLDDIKTEPTKPIMGFIREGNGRVHIGEWSRPPISVNRIILGIRIRSFKRLRKDWKGRMWR